MITDLKELISTCKNQMVEMEYAPAYRERIFKKFDKMMIWAHKKNLESYSFEIGERFLTYELGFTHKERCLNYEESLFTIAIKKIEALQQTGDIAPVRERKEFIFPEEYSYLIDGYMNMMEMERCNKQSSISRKMVVIRDFLQYISSGNISLAELKEEHFLAFMKFKDSSSRYKYDSSNFIRDFLEYASKMKFCDSNVPKQIPHFTSRITRQLPSVFSHEEIRKLLASFDRASSIGKRDYLMTLLAAVYGWRAADILEFEFSSIDWNRNMIEFNQQKSGNYVSYPLLPEVGNAIIDYVQNGRPITEQKCIIVSHITSYKGKPMNPCNLNAIIAVHMKKADIKNWKNRKHGPHSLRYANLPSFQTFFRKKFPNNKLAEKRLA